MENVTETKGLQEREREGVRWGGGGVCAVPSLARRMEKDE